MTVHTDGEGPRAVDGAGMAQQRLLSESTIGAKKQKVLAFCAEARESWWQIKVDRAELENHETIYDRQELWSFAGGAVLDLASGLVERYGPGEGVSMMIRLVEADVLTSYGGLSNSLDYFSEFGSIEPLKKKHIHIRLEYEVDHPRMDQDPWQPQLKEEYSPQKMYQEGRIEDLLKHCEEEARTAAEVYRAVETIERLEAKPYVVETFYGGQKEVPIEPLTTAIYVHRDYARYRDDEDE